MSRATIESLYNDFTVLRTEAREYGIDYELYAKLAEIEVVPRKMVEMIIGKCVELERENGGRMNDEPIQFGKSCAAEDIAEFAESLLKQFEEERNE